VEADVKTSTRETKNRREDDIRNDMKKLKIKIRLAASSIAISGNYMLNRPKCSKNEVVAPKKEEGEEEPAICTICLLLLFILK
jgi:hypothetical protein